MMLPLADLRNDAPRDKFPVYISNAGRSHEDAKNLALRLSNDWGIGLEYVPDEDSKQGMFFVDGSSMTNLEIQGLHYMIGYWLKTYYDEAYDLENP